MESKNIKTIAALVALLGGCTAIQAGPKLLWSSNVLKKADQMNWICVGTGRLGEITNPVTWFFPPPDSHYFVTQDTTRELPGLNQEYLVQQYMLTYEEDQSTFISRFDLASNKNAYIKNVEYTSDEDARKNIDNPDWEPNKTEWSKNIVRWIKDGKPMNANYCS